MAYKQIFLFLTFFVHVFPRQTYASWQQEVPMSTIYICGLADNVGSTLHPFIIPRSFPEIQDCVQRGIQTLVRKCKSQYNGIPSSAPVVFPGVLKITENCAGECYQQEELISLTCRLNN